MKKYLFVLIAATLFSCNINKKEPQNVNNKIDSIETLNDSIQHLNLNIIELYDSISLLKNKTIQKVELVNLKILKSKSVYTKNCKFCHGEYGKGDGIKAKLNDDLCPFDLTKETKSDEEIYYILLNGVNNMPNKNLNEDDIWLLIVYIKKFKDK
jgi:hypothetical protein